MVKPNRILQWSLKCFYNGLHMTVECRCTNFSALPVSHSVSVLKSRANESDCSEEAAGPRQTVRVASSSTSCCRPYWHVQKIHCIEPLTKWSQAPSRPRLYWNNEAGSGFWIQTRFHSVCKIVLTMEGRTGDETGSLCLLTCLQTCWYGLPWTRVRKLHAILSRN